MNNIVNKVISCLSIVVALSLLYIVIQELSEGSSIFDIALIPLLITLIVVANGVMGFLLLTGKIRPQRPLFIFQTLIILSTCLLLYNILFNSTISCT